MPDNIATTQVEAGAGKQAETHTDIEKLWYIPPAPALPRGWVVYSLNFVLAVLQGRTAEPHTANRNALWLAVGSFVRIVMAIAQGFIMLLAWIPIISACLETVARVFGRNAIGFFIRACYWKSKLAHLGQDTIFSQNVEIWGASSVSIGSRCHIDREVRLAAGERRHGQHGSIKIGNFVHLGPGVHIAGRGNVQIGDFVGIMANAHIYSATGAVLNPSDPGHLISISHMAPPDMQHIVEGPIQIEDYAFVGMMSQIMPRVKVGFGAVIHANCQLTRDVPPFANFGGTPPGRQIGWRKPLRQSPHLLERDRQSDGTTQSSLITTRRIQRVANADVDKREVYKDDEVVSTYDNRLYFGWSGGLFFEREAALSRDLFPDTGRVFDCPSGTGKLGRALKNKPGLTLIGGDISPLMVARSKETGCYEDVKIIDLTKTHFPDEHFDVVFVSRFFMLFPKLDDFIVEIRRILKPGGILIYDSVRRSIHNLVHRTIGTTEGWNYPRSTQENHDIFQSFGFECVSRRSAFLLSTGTMNRLPPPLFKLLSSMETILPERLRVMEMYVMRKT